MPKPTESAPVAASPLLRQLYDCWDARRRQRVMPIASEIDIGDLRASELRVQIHQALSTVLQSRALNFIAEDCIQDRASRHIEGLLSPASRGGAAVDLLLGAIIVQDAGLETTQALSKVAP
jgi:hypothetical protein